jgi:glycosyltransferase involved in cell wall biosynthesis
VAGTNFRDDAPCHQCRPGWRVPGIRHACYADSRTASGLVTAATSLFRRNAQRRVTAVAISDHMRRWLVDEAGFAADRVRLKYNGVAGPPVGTPLEPAEASRAFVFAGHLTDHKGVTLLLDAWRRIGDVPASLVVLGDGPRATDVRAEVAADPRISWLGAVAAEEIPTHLATARAAIVPSVWEEPFGRTAAEALACGRPVVTTGTGGLAEVVDESSGWITGTDPAQLAAAIVEAATADAEVERRSRAARQRHADRFSPEATTKALLGVYDEVIH